MKVVMDCDNTIGIPGRDLDDALALFYLLGRDDVELIGVTTTFGNGSVEEVYANTKGMFRELKIDHIPLFLGASSRNERRSPAADFLADVTAKHPHGITVLATGAMTNLLGAWQVDHNFFRNLRAGVLMGGVTAALVINGQTMDELNFSCDPEAACHVLRSDCETTVITGNLCLQALLDGQRLGRIAGQTEFAVFNYIQKPVTEWSEYLYEKYGLAGFHVWDAVAASYVVKPELFDDCWSEVLSTPADLETGLLKIASENEHGYRVNMPTEIRDRDRFWGELFQAWENAL